MDFCYYNTQIKEELDGAADYIKRASACKKEHPDFAKLYVNMSDQELGHAKNLVDMFEEEYKVCKTDDPIYSQIHDSLINMYTEFAGRVKQMQNVYSSK